jgi:hypothetical protein
MRFPVAAVRRRRHSALGLFAVTLGATLFLPPAARAAIEIKDRTINEPLVLDQNDDYYLNKVYLSGVTDVAALTLTGKINSVNLSHCVFSNVWAGMNGKAVAAESQGAIVNHFVASDTAFEDAQHQLVCLREGAFGTVTFQRCKFRTTDSFLKKIYAADPWRTTPPTTEFANIDRLELLDNEYVNTTLVVHSSVKVVIFRGDISNVRLQSPSTHVIRLERNQDPSVVPPGATAVAIAVPEAAVVPEAVVVENPASTQVAFVPNVPAIDPAVADDAPADEEGATSVEASTVAPRRPAPALLEQRGTAVPSR